MMITANLLLLDTSTSAKRFLPRYLSSENSTNFNNYVNWNLTFIFKSIIFFVILLALLMVIIFIMHILHIKDYQSYHLAIYLLILSPLPAILILMASFLNCNKNYLWAQAIIGPLKYGVFIIIFSPSIFLLFIFFM